MRAILTVLSLCAAIQCARAENKVSLTVTNVSEYTVTAEIHNGSSRAIFFWDDLWQIETKSESGKWIRSEIRGLARDIPSQLLLQVNPGEKQIRRYKTLIFQIPEPNTTCRIYDFYFDHDNDKRMSMDYWKSGSVAISNGFSIGKTK